MNLGERWFLLILVELLTITQWIEVRGDFCWYWWNCWPLQYLSFCLKKFNTEPSIHADVSYLVSVHLAKQFQRRRFIRNRPISNKNCLWWPCLLTDWHEMSNLHWWHSTDNSYQVSVVVMFVNRSERNEQSSLMTFHRCFQPIFGGNHIC